MRLPHQRSIYLGEGKDSVLARLSFFTDHPSPVTRHQSQIDHLVSQFITEASDWKLLASLTTGGLAYRWGRVMVRGPWSVVLGRGNLGGHFIRGSSIAFGLASEVSAFELTHRSLSSLTRDQGPRTKDLWSWFGPGGWKQSLLSDLITFGMLKGAGHLSRETNVLLQHTFASTAMVAGHQMAGVLGILPRPEGTLPEQFLHAELTNLQLGAGMGLVHALAPGLYSLERGLDVSSRFNVVGAGILPPSRDVQLRAGGSPPLHLQTVMAGSPSPRPSPSRERGGVSNISLMTGGRESNGGEIKKVERPLVPSETEKEELIQKFSPLFPSVRFGIFSPHIIGKALATPSSIPHFHERLLRAYASAFNRGSMDQLYTVIALEKVFLCDALRGPTGTLNHALIQRFVEKAMEDPSVNRGTQSLLVLFELMERGLTPQNLEQVMDSFGYLKGLALPRVIASFDESSSPVRIEASLDDYRPKDRILLINHVFEWAPGDSVKVTRLFKILRKARVSGRYDPDDIDAVIARAMKSPYGRLILDRMFAAFVVEDVPSKLKELLDEGDTPDTHLRIRELLNQGLSPPQIAERINATRHTGYLDDSRLAQKIVEVMSEALPSLENPKRREASRNLLEDAIEQFLSTGEKKLTTEKLLEFYQKNPSALSSWLVAARDAKKVRIEVISTEEFEARVKRWGKVPETRLAVFLRDVSAPIPDQILISELPKIDLTTRQGQEKAFNEILLRIRSLAHEGEHFRHFTEMMDFTAHLNRHDQLVSESLAYTVEFGWRIQNLDNDMIEIARRMGLTLALHFRNVADLSYYVRINRKLVGEVREE